MTLQEIFKDGDEVRESTRRFSLPKEDFEKVLTLVERQNEARKQQEQQQKKDPQEEYLTWRSRKYKIYPSTVSALIADGKSDADISRLLDVPYQIMHKFISLNRLREENKYVKDSF